jgi:hypothetical protein
MHKQFYNIDYFETRYGFYLYKFCIPECLYINSVLKWCTLIENLGATVG